MRRCPGLAVALVSGVATAGCANEQPPPGTHPDLTPPTLRAIEPANDSIVPGFDGSVRVRWDEPVRVEAGSFARDLIASPVEPYLAEVGFSDVRIRPRDGWRDSTVYCMEIPAGISDLLNNRTQDAQSFCFSTGAPIIDSRVGGTILDAVTGRPVPEATVLFLTPPDSTPYGALTNTEGRFELRALPPGSYETLGFLDRNRNFQLDRTLEPYDSATVSAFDGARSDLLMRLVEPDTTPPRLLRAQTWDSVTIQIEFDDPLLRPQPGSPTVAVSDSVTGAALELTEVLLGEASATRPPATAGADSAAAPADTTGIAPDSLAAETAELPTRFVSVRLAGRIPDGTYRVHAEGFVNLRGLSGGGDTTFVAAPDTVSVPADSAGARTDSLGVPPDTVGIPPDSLAPAPDSLGVPPDSTRPPPDTLRALPRPSGSARPGDRGRLP